MNNRIYTERLKLKLFQLFWYCSSVLLYMYICIMQGILCSSFTAPLWYFNSLSLIQTLALRCAALGSFIRDEQSRRGSARLGSARLGSARLGSARRSTNYNFKIWAFINKMLGYGENKQRIFYFKVNIFFYTPIFSQCQLIYSLLYTYLFLIFGSCKKIIILFNYLLRYKIP